MFSTMSMCLHQWLNFSKTSIFKHNIFQIIVVSHTIYPFPTFLQWQHLTRRRQWHPTPMLLPRESHGRKSLVGCRLWGRIELDTTEATQRQQQQSLEQTEINVCCLSHPVYDVFVWQHGQTETTSQRMGQKIFKLHI